MKINPNLISGVTTTELLTQTKILANTNSSVSITLPEEATNFDFLLLNICANPSTHTGEWCIMKPLANGCSIISTQLYLAGSYRLIIVAKYYGDSTKKLEFISRMNEHNGTAGVVSILGVKLKG